MLGGMEHKNTVSPVCLGGLLGNYLEGEKFLGAWVSSLVVKLDRTDIPVFWYICEIILVIILSILPLKDWSKYAPATVSTFLRAYISFMHCEFVCESRIVIHRWIRSLTLLSLPPSYLPWSNSSAQLMKTVASNLWCSIRLHKFGCTESDCMSLSIKNT